MMGFGIGGIGLLVMLAFLVAVIGLAVWLVGALFPRTTSSTGSGAFPSFPPHEETALDILKKRYARGELTRSEYEAMRRDILSDAR